MAEVNCAACEDLRNNVPELIVNGLSDDMCTSLQNDTGLKPSVGHNDCTDLENLNDCLVGNLETEVEKYDVCDWRDFTKELIGNLWTVSKAMVCSICGIWTNIHNLWNQISALWAQLASAGSYTLTKDGNYIVLNSDSGEKGRVPDADTQYQLHTKTYTLANVVVVAGDTAVVDVPTPQPSEYTDTLYPMTVAGWTWEGTYASYLITRYIQLVDRSGTPKVRVAVRNIAAPASDGSHNANVTLYVEVLWWGLRTA